VRKLEVFCRFIGNINDRLGKIVSFTIAFIIGVVTIEVVLRYVFNSPTCWALETTIFLYGTYTILGGGYALLYNRHIGVDIFHKRFSPRNRAIVDLVTSLLFFAFVGATLWYGVPFAWHSVEIQERTCSFWNPPVWPVKLMLPLGIFSLALQGIAKFFSDLETAITKREGLAAVARRKEVL